MSLLSAAALMLVAQQSGAAVLAEYPDDPESWTLEYPNAIGGFVEDYYNCLRSGEYVIGDGRGFEAQYREDIPRCGKLAAEMEASANARLAEKGAAAATTREDVAVIFETARRIHVARGRSLDETIRTRLAADLRYQQMRAADTDRACIARIEALRARRGAYSDEHRARVAAVHGKDEYTDGDRRAIAEYQGTLGQYTARIEAELRTCPAAEYVTADSGPTGPARNNQ